jgi:hypothetical protein
MSLRKKGSRKLKEDVTVAAEVGNGEDRGSTPGYKVIKECMPRPRVGEHLRTC